VIRTYSTLNLGKDAHGGGPDPYALGGGPKPSALVLCPRRRTYAQGGGPMPQKTKSRVNPQSAMMEASTCAFLLIFGLCFFWNKQRNLYCQKEDKVHTASQVRPAKTRRFLGFHLNVSFFNY
jgi:hypothetical protein